MTHLGNEQREDQIAAIGGLVMTMMAGEYLDSGPLTDLTNGEEVSDGRTQESSSSCSSLTGV